MIESKGKLVVISGPSGSGKSTVISKIFSARDKLLFSVSATTRAMRPGEIDGVNYFFVTRDEFIRMIENDELLEHTEYVGNYYGTPKAAIMQKLDEGIDVILDIETEGAMNVKRKMPECVSIFLIPPSFSELSKRLHGRGTDSEEVITERLKTAAKEYKLAENYDYIVINDVVEEAAEEVMAIIKAEKCRSINRLGFTDTSK